MFQSLIDAGCALFKHLHLLITKSHVVKHDEKVIFVTSASCKVNHVHDAVSFLQEVKSTFILLSLDKLVSWVVEFCHNYGYFVFAHTKLLVIVPIECVIFIIALCSLTVRCFSLYVPCCAFARLFATTIARSSWVLVSAVLIVTPTHVKQKD